MHLTRWSLTIVFAALAILLDIANLTVPILARKRGQDVAMVPLALIIHEQYLAGRRAG